MILMKRARKTSKISNSQLLHINLHTPDPPCYTPKIKPNFNIFIYTPPPTILLKRKRKKCISTWICPTESRPVSEECLSLTWWTSSLCFSLRMVSSWSPSCSASNRAATRDCGLWRIGTRIPPGRSFMDLLRGTYVGGVFGALVILRIASASTTAVSCCVDRITRTIQQSLHVHPTVEIPRALKCYNKLAVHLLGLRVIETLSHVKKPSWTIT